MFGIDKNTEQEFEVSSDSSALFLSTAPKVFRQCVDGKAPPEVLRQYILLEMLEESGIATRLPDGFEIASEDAIALAIDDRNELALPQPWPGQINVEIKGHTKDTAFQLKLILVGAKGELITHYTFKGPLLHLTDREFYLPSPAQWFAFRAIEEHLTLEPDERNEYNNLLAISRLKTAQSNGLRASLRHFEKIQAVEPDKVSLSLTIDEEGNGELLPAFNGWTREELESSIRSFQENDTQSLRSAKDGKILLLDKERVKAVKEILSNRNLDKEQVKVFIKAPGAFIDASLVDLDIGFSLRVTGVEKFVHAYFGETDESGIEWFSHRVKTGEYSPPSKLVDLISSEEDLERIQQIILDAESTGADSITVDGTVVDISDSEAVKKSLQTAAKQIRDTDDTPSVKSKKEESKDGAVVIAIDKNDDQVGFGETKSIEQVAFNGSINYSDYLREPYDYQDGGIRWLLGMSADTAKTSREDLGKRGVLLADDMGLGKTFMCLVAMREYFEQVWKAENSTLNPVLVVAPLSLLENWKEEVEKTYRQSPFDSIVILQSDADLSKFKKQGARSELRQEEGAQLENVKYALNVGSGGPSRLDMPKRLVLTTYHTLRDYQFSLAKVDWSIVIFDEAQNIKNPNALATVAAKAMKAHFKILATGTPVENSLADFWSLMDTAIPGKLGAYQDFRQKYVTPIARASEEEKSDVRIKIGQQLRADVGHFMLRRTKEESLKGLPEKRIFTGDTEKPGETYHKTLDACMPSKQFANYETVIQVTNELQSSGEGGNAILSGLQRLRDVSLHPGLVEGGIITAPRTKREAVDAMSESGKLAAMLDILGEIKARNEKAIVFLINKSLQSFLKTSLRLIYKIDISIINGDTKAIAKRANTETRRSLIKEFESNEGFGIILMSPIAAGTGLTIVGANNVIHLERHWNPAKEAQATDRVYRIGQERDVNVYLPILKHPDEETTSFDQNLNRLLVSKVALKDAVVTPQEVDPDDLGSGMFGGETNPQPQPTYYRVEDLDELSWQQFETFAAVLLSKYFDCEAMLTKSGPDMKADVVLTKGRNALVQVKHTRTGTLKTESAIQEVSASRIAYEEAMGQKFDELIVFTNAKNFGKNFKKSLESYSVSLFDLKEIRKLLKKYPVTQKEILMKQGKDRISIR